jgi:hypothetical protein
VNVEGLRALVESADVSELPKIRGVLMELDALVLGRLLQANPVSTTTPTEERWLTPEQAAEILCVPVDRVYDLARGKRWANKVTRKCLRIQEAQFRAWIRNR